MLDRATLLAVLPNTPNVDTVLPYLTTAMLEAQATTPLRVCMWLAQWGEESGSFSKFVENLNYSAPALVEVFPSHFDAQLAAQYARQPERIANHAYANRNGNRDEASGDGWLYRGRSIAQVTFHDNYRDCGTYLGIDLLKQPEQLETLQYAFRAAAWYWKGHSLNAVADVDNLKAGTKLVNGGYNGLDRRQVIFDKCKQVLGIR